MLEVKVGPPQLAIHRGYGVLLTEPDCQIRADGNKGLYFYDTRLISVWQIFADGEEWKVLNSGTLTHFASRCFLTNRTIRTEKGEIPDETLSLVINRIIGDGVREDLDLTNFGQDTACFNLEIGIRCDFADIFEVKVGGIVRRGRITTEWDAEDCTLVSTYCHRDFVRAVRVRAGGADSRPVMANGRISFAVELKPGAHWHACLFYDLRANGQWHTVPPGYCDGAAAQSEGHRVLHRSLDDWVARVTSLESENPLVARLFRQAVTDMAALRLPVGEGKEHFIPAAGLPWFVAVFGRDSLIASLQNVMTYPRFAHGALEILASLQADRCDTRRDAAPGKIPHELRQGELAHFNIIPHTPYYGTADATPLYLVVLHSAWRCSGDRALLERHLGTAERCLEWIDRYGDRDGDGLQEYEKQSPESYENQSWKDAGEAVVRADGTQVKGMKATCELQGYVFDAWMRMAEIYDFLGRTKDAAALRDKAASLQQRFDAAFWDEATGFYAFALDAEKRKVLSVASNPGHCLWSGIVPEARAERVVRRLLREDMWSGFGIRTLSAENPAFNPFSYQTGSVWPHDNGLIALGFRRYGFHAEAAQVARGVFDAGSFFALNQMPELYAGVARAESGFPVQYLGANVPQAWAAGSVFALVQALVGYEPDAPRGRLVLRPRLPDWLPGLTLRNVHVGEQVLDLRFRRLEGQTIVDVLRGDPGYVAVDPA